MKKLRKEKFKGIGGNPSRVKMKMSKRTRVVTFIFSVITILTTAGIMQAANVYYDLDTSTIVMNEIIDQTGAGQVSFSGNVDATNGLDVTTANLTVGGSNFTVAPATGNVTTIGSIGIRESDGAAFYTYFQGGNQGANITYTLPTAVAGGSGDVLTSDTNGVLSWSSTAAATPHALLDGTINNDTAANPPLQGSLIVGNATPAWSRLTIGSAGRFLTSDGSDVSWGNVLGADHGGTGIANNAASTLTITGNFPTTLTVSNTTGVTLPTSGTLYGTASDSITSANLLGSVTNETGSGLLVFATSPSLTTPNIGVASGTTLSLSNTGSLTIGTASSATGQIIVRNASNANTQTIAGSAATGNYTYTLPTTKGGTFAMTTDINSFEATGILRGQVNIFGFDYPAQCSTTCADGAYATISRDIIALPNFPVVLSGKTRKHRLVIRYADDLASNGNTTVEIWKTDGTPATLDSFTIAGLSAEDDLEKGKVFVSGDLAIPTNTDDWVVRVTVPATNDIIRIYSIELAAYDVD